MPKLTPYQLLVQTWKTCTDCSLCKHRKQVVFCRGTLPCEVLFVGEAPGPSEDVIGRPFVGPAGELLNRMVEEANQRGFAEKLAFANLVGCIPKDKEGRGAPKAAEIEACKDRLLSIIKLAKPSVIVCVGALVHKEATRGSWQSVGFASHNCFNILHPAYILRQDKSQQQLLIQRTIITLEEAFASLIPF